MSSRAYVDVELGIDPDDLTNPWQAALSSAVSFTLGALLPLIAMLAPPRIPVTFAAVLLALAPTGTISARLGGADPRRAVLRIVVGRTIAMMVTYRIGQPLGVAGV